MMPTETKTAKLADSNRGWRGLARRGLLFIGWAALLALGSGPAVLADETAPVLRMPASPVKAEAESSLRLRSTVDKLQASLTSDKRIYARLVKLCDSFGPRLSGSDNLERAIDWILAELQRDGLTTARGEPVMVPRWVRGQEELLSLIHI